MTEFPPIDRLSCLLQRFRISAELLHSGALCGVNEFDEGNGKGYLHVLRRGTLQVKHPRNTGLPLTLTLCEPSLLFYPQPIQHQFVNEPAGSEFTCARLNFEGGRMNPLVKALPKLMVLPLSKIAGLESALELLFAETDRVMCGHRLLADRLFEVVFIQMLRWLLDNPEETGIQSGLIFGLSDPRLSRSLVAMHESPGLPWSLEEMADCAGMSRTSFTTTFKNIVGQTPAEYLADWRITIVQSGLRKGIPIALLTEEVGYATPSALSRFFSGRVGHSPRKWLQMQS
jgi:AraC-like DNA-binding protein